MNYPVQEIRSLFPALQRVHLDRPAAYLDGPGGTQMVATAITAMTNYIRRGMANLHGRFPSSEETEEIILAAREALADMLGMKPCEIAFGANATSLMFSVSRALAQDWNPGDEIVVSELDHRSHVDTWILAAKDRGVTVRWLRVNPDTLTLDLDRLGDTINTKTKFVAVGYASNAVGTINDVRKISDYAKRFGAIVSVDAVHIAPHIGVDIERLGADIVFCSVYKIFGGHLGVVGVRAAVFEAMRTYRLMPAPATIPGKLETGTQNHEGMATVVPALNFVACLGQGETRRERLLSGFARIEAHENELADIIRTGLTAIPGVRLYQSPEGFPKTATIAFTMQGWTPEAACRALADRFSVFVADGDFYATTLADKLDINKDGGWIRAGLAPYNTAEEAALLVAGVEKLMKTPLQPS